MNRKRDLFQDARFEVEYMIRTTERTMEITLGDPFRHYPAETMAPILESLSISVATFRSELESAGLFFGLVQWIDAVDTVREPVDLVQQLVGRIRSFLFSMIHTPQPPRSFILRCLELKVIRGWASKWSRRFSIFAESIDSFKPEIKKLFINSQAFASSSLFRFRVPDKEYAKDWDSFFVPLISRLEEMAAEDYCTSFPGLSQLLVSFTRDWKFFNSIHRKLIGASGGYNLSLPLARPFFRDFLVLIGNFGVAAGLLYCEFWCGRKELDAEMAEEFTNALLKLQLTNPDYMHTTVKAIRECVDLWHPSRPFSDSFVDWLKVSCGVIGEKNPSLIAELNILIRLLIFVPLSEDLVFESFSKDIRGLIREVAPIQEEIQQQEHYVNLFSDIWFLKMEICLRVLMAPVIRNVSLLRHIEKVTCFPFPVEAKEQQQDMDRVLKLQQEVSGMVNSVHVGTITREMASDAFHKSLLKILLFKAESFIAKLVHREQDTTSQMKSLLQGMAFLSRFMGYLPDGELPGIQSLFMATDAAMRRVISLRSSILAPSIPQESMILVPGVLQEITKVKDMFIIDPMKSFPKTDGLNFIDFLLRKLKDCLESQVFSVAHPPIKGIVRNLKDFKLLLSAIPEGNLQVQELKERVLDAAYEVEHHIDLLELGTGTTWCILLRLSQRMEYMDVLILQLRKINENNKGYGNQIETTNHTPSLVPSQYQESKIGNITVGTDLHEQEIIDRLTRSSSRQEIVSITGMGGIGKTTLALNVYNSRKVSVHFYVQAWCYVSQQYKKGFDKKRLLLEILSDFVGHNKNLSLMSDDELEAELRKQLLERRYLIVLDDLWCADAWNDLRQSLPDDGNGSKILITTRDSNLDLDTKGISYQHVVHPMSVDDSWNLLKMKISHTKPLREELVVIGREIAAKCQGMPLAIVSIAGLLERAVESQELWVEMEESLSSVVMDNAQTGCMKILELSYKHLPDYLKPCFLYFASFPGDHVIMISKLTQLWIAEGFIRASTSTSLEDIAHGYLMELLNRNLVMVGKSRSDGGVKSCRVHDLLREMCLAKAREDKFLQLVTRHEESDLSYGGIDYGVYVDGDYPLESVTYNDHRLCIFVKRKYFAISKPSGARVRSLMFFALSDLNPGYLYDLSFVCDRFKLLKVLDLERINMDGASFELFKSLIHLRYLAVSGTINSVPSSLEFLKYLESFHLKGLSGLVILPPNIWHLTRLRHLCISQRAVFSFQENNSAFLPKLESLVSLSSPLISSPEDLERITTRLPNLRKLRCVFSRSKNSLSSNSDFLRIDFPVQLESLSIAYYASSNCHFEFNFPLNLKKLTLSNFGLQWNQISSIGKLEHLEVLKLLSKAFEGETWEMTEGEFPKLKFLKLESLDIKEWVASSDSLPNLQKLVLRRCRLLNEVPISFAEINTLETIEVHGCGDPCVKSVDDIREENDNLKVVISHAG